MTHTVDGWAVQYKASGTKHHWKFDGLFGFTTYQHKYQAKQAMEEISHSRIETRIVRVRQTTEVIEG